MIHVPEKPPKFQPGELVHHLRYGYRGVIVAVDATCASDDAWYQRNQTQPNRNQPWYHVLVHRAGHTTYVAESNLEPDREGHEIEHAWVGVFFDAFIDGRYRRNETPWPPG
jgi:heat shock protein HspQ